MISEFPGSDPGSVSSMISEISSPVRSLSSVSSVSDVSVSAEISGVSALLLPSALPPLPFISSSSELKSTLISSCEVSAFPLSESPVSEFPSVAELLSSSI